YRREARVEGPSWLRRADLRLPLPARQAAAPGGQLGVPLVRRHRCADEQVAEQESRDVRAHRRNRIGYDRDPCWRRWNPDAPPGGVRDLWAELRHQQPPEALHHECLARIGSAAGELAEVTGDVNEQSRCQLAVGAIAPACDVGGRPAATRTQPGAPQT